MNIVIIEDERMAAEDLAAILREVKPDAKVLATLASVAEALEWFSRHPAPDLIFSDIQLGDGQCFDLFSQHPPEAPVIFCTAFDDHALKAFQSNGIAYILKPVSGKEVRAALEKLDRLSSAAQMKAYLDQAGRERQTVLVHFRDRIIPIALKDIALFHIRNEITHLRTFDGRDFVLSQTLEDLERTAGSAFFRAGRQYLIHRSAIREAQATHGRKLSLILNFPFDDVITVSKEKASAFRDWMERG